MVTNILPVLVPDAGNTMWSRRLCVVTGKEDAGAEGKSNVAYLVNTHHPSQELFNHARVHQ
jgi:hypothetical protein